MELRERYVPGHADLCENVVHVCCLLLQPSFHELLPSESHRRLQYRHLHLTLSESESHASSPAHSRPVTPSVHSEHSPSPFRAGEDSFFQFMSRMMEQYMKEEEVRARHRSLLLQLREKTLTVSPSSVDTLCVSGERLVGCLF